MSQDASPAGSLGRITGSDAKFQQALGFKLQVAPCRGRASGDEGGRDVLAIARVTCLADDIVDALAFMRSA
jgi:hypothetical protein